MYKEDVSGVKDAIVSDAPFGKVEVKTLTKKQIYQYISGRDFTPLNTTLLYYNSHNLDMACELVKEGKLKWRNCMGAALEVA